ncbi:MAG: (2Fe-2S)-binding protein [Candidatus Nitrosocaldaceae archaeon]|nr:MAG: (2Fe-2S)-binding protein [Candidatus Nitrosocaldaceae archaeon]
MIKLLVKACKLSDIDNIFSIDIDDKKIMLIRKDDKIYALDRICTHQYADLSNGFITDDTITCPLHLAQFEITSGKAVSPPAEEPLKLYNIKIEGDDIYVEI